MSVGKVVVGALFRDQACSHTGQPGKKQFFTILYYIIEDDEMASLLNMLGLLPSLN